jgi:chromosome segregation ATPase
MAETLDTLGEKIAALTVSFGEVRKQLDGHDKRFDQIDRHFEQIDTRFEQIDTRFEQIDTRFEQIDTRFVQIDTRFEQIDTRFVQIDTRFVQIDKRFVQIDKRFDQVDQRIAQVDARVSQLDQRVDEQGSSLRILIEAVDSKVDLVLEKVTHLMHRDVHNSAGHAHFETRLDNHELRLIALESGHRPPPASPDAGDRGGS